MRTNILNMGVDITSLPNLEQEFKGWCDGNIGRYICVSNVHMCMEVFDSSEYAKAVNGSDITVADGKPIAWAQRLLGFSSAQQVRGADLTLAMCEYAEKANVPIGFYGATTELLKKLEMELKVMFPELKIAYSFAPPFRPLTKEEEVEHINAINSSGIKILFVGLGCPKQEIWMSKHKGSLHCLMLGVGAAFDFIAGNKKHAPIWMQSIGLEWLFRLISEPRRLWKRYLKHNPRFLWYFFLQILGKKYS